MAEIFTLSAVQAPRTAQQLAAQAIGDAIRRGDLAPGVRLVQAELAAGLGVSITPVREALRDLAADGLVRVDPHRGATVPGLDAGEVRETFALRLLVEPEALHELAGRLPAATLGTLTALTHRLARETDPACFAEQHAHLERLLAGGDGSGPLATVLRGLQGRAAPAMAQGLRVGVVDRAGLADDAAALREALAAGTSGCAAEIVRQRLERVFVELAEGFADGALGSSPTTKRAAS